METKKPLTEEDTPFNMAMLYYMQINECMREQSIAMVKGDLVTAINWLNEIYTKAIIKLNQKEIDEIDSDLQSIESGMNKLSNSPIHKISTTNRIRQTTRKLMTIMHKYHMIMPNVKIRDKFQDIRAKFGLTNIQKKAET